MRFCIFVWYISIVHVFSSVNIMFSKSFEVLYLFPRQKFLKCSVRSVFQTYKNGSVERKQCHLFCHIFSTTLNTFVLCWTSTLVVLAQTDARAVLKLSRSLCGAPAVTSQEMGKWGCWALERKAFGDVCSTTSHSAVLKPSVAGNAEPFSCRVLALIKAWEIFFMSQQRLVMFDTCRRNRCRK